MTPPDLPARPAPRASITDVVPRRTLVVIALIVVLAVIGTVLALTLGGDDESGNGAQGAGGDRTAAESTPSADTRNDEEGGTRTDGTATASAGGDASAEASPGSTGTGAGSPGGSQDGGAGGEEKTQVSTTHRSKQGYSIGLPAGWTYKSSGPAGDRFTGPNGQKLLIGWTTTPKDDPVADWKNQEGAMVRSQYKRVRIVPVEYRGWKTADWEFTYVEGGVAYRAVDRGTVVNDGLGYGLLYTARADAWDGEQRKDTWRTLTETFRPKS